MTKPSPSPNLSQAPLNPLLYLEHINTLTLIPGPPSPVVVRILLSQVRENLPSWISINPACHQQESFYPSCLLLVFHPLTPPNSMQVMIPQFVFPVLSQRAHLNCNSIANYVNAAAAAKSLQSCPTLCDPYMAAQQAPSSLGFSRQKHWSGLLFPSPMHESEK